MKPVRLRRSDQTAQAKRAAWSRPQGLREERTRRIRACRADLRNQTADGSAARSRAFDRASKNVRAPSSSRLCCARQWNSRWSIAARMPRKRPKTAWTPCRDHARSAPPMRRASRCGGIRGEWRRAGTSGTPAQRRAVDHSEFLEASQILFPGSSHIDIGLDPNYAIAVFQEDLGQHSGTTANINNEMLGIQIAGFAESRHDLGRVARTIFDVVIDAVGEALGGSRLRGGHGCILAASGSAVSAPTPG